MSIFNTFIIIAIHHTADGIVVQPVSGEFATHQSALDRIKSYANESIRLRRKQNPEAVFAIRYDPEIDATTVTCNGDTVIQYHISKCPYKPSAPIDPESIINITDIHHTGGLMRCKVELQNGKVVDIVYDIDDETNQYHFWYKNGDKPSDPDFEYKLICKL